MPSRLKSLVLPGDAMRLWSSTAVLHGLVRARITYLYRRSGFDLSNCFVLRYL